MAQLAERTAPFPVEELTVATAAGERVEIWRCAPSGVPDLGAVALLPGFCRSMRHMAPVTAYLAARGFTVYRCDFVDHVGLSQGAVEAFTMSGAARSLTALLEAMAEREPGDSFCVAAASLSMRIATRVAAEGPRVAGVVGIVGVVDARSTLRRVFGEDYAALPLERLHGEHSVFEDKRIEGHRFMSDFHAAGWGSLESTIADIRGLEIPIANFCAGDDEWVDLADVREAFDRGAGGPRRIFELPYGEHEFSLNPVAARTLLRGVTEQTAAICGGPAEAPAEPDFHDLASQAICERRLEAGRRGDSDHHTRRDER
jgi:hypothetical protein